MWRLNIKGKYLEACVVYVVCKYMLHELKLDS